MEKWKDRKDFIFSSICLVGSGKVKGWKKWVWINLFIYFIKEWCPIKIKKWYIATHQKKKKKPGLENQKNNKKKVTLPRKRNKEKKIKEATLPKRKKKGQQGNIREEKNKK